MGQQDVKKVLEKEGNWLISNEIAKKAGYSLKSIQSSLRRLVKWGHVEKQPASKVIEDEKRLKDRSFAGYAYKIKEYKTISDLNFSNKNVLLLTDLESIKTIKELYLQPKIKLFILPHTNKKDMVQYSELLSSKLNKKVTFIDNISSLKDGLNESNPKKQSKSKLVQLLSPHFDTFVNDAFSISNKLYASTVGFSYLLPTYLGREFEDNLNKLEQFKNSKSIITFVLGGDKSESLIKLIENNNKKTNLFLLTGLISHLALKEKGFNLGNPSKLLDKQKVKSNKFFKNVLKDSENILTPLDLALSTFGSRDEIRLKDFPVYQAIHDLGEKTINGYANLIKNSKVVFFKGLPGNYREENFHNGTETLLKSLQETKAEVYVIGKRSSEALEHFKIDTKNFKYASEHSEPSLVFLNTGTLPVLDMLKEKI